MRLIDITTLSLESLRGRKLRSWLTVLGIVIAVASIVTLVSLALGVNQQVSSRLNMLGNDLIQITPGGSQATRTGGGFAFGGGAPGGFEARGGGGTGFPSGTNRQSGMLTFGDAEELEHVDGVLAVDARLEGRLRSEYKGKNASLQMVGVDPDAFRQVNSATVLAGRLLGANDRYSIVLGYRVYNSTYAGEDMLNRQIKIGDYSFRVVGLLNQTSGSFVTSDSAVYFPLETAKLVLNESDNANQVFVKVNPGRTADEVAALLEQKLMDLHRVTADQEDFTITTASFFASAAADVTNMLSLFLGGIAAISLLVGAIGVANTMFMSVLERTREIGVLKALGMKDSEITAMFLVEAAALGAAGGVLGVGLSLLISQVLALFGLVAVVTVELMLGAILFSAVIGILAGAAPARNAAGLQPVEALRYE